MPTLRRLRRRAALLAAVGALATAGTAARAATPPPSALTAGVRETVLPNGLTLLVKEVRNAPVVSFSVWYRVGTRNEHTGITGVSHLLEHMLFKGTRQYRLGEIARTLFLNGASFNASTYYDWTNYYATIAADRLELAMRIEADRMVNSRIDKVDLDAEMTVVRSELEGGENSQFHIVKLNRGYDANGKVTVAPKLVFNTPGWDDQLLRDIGHGNVSIENSVAIQQGKLNGQEAFMTGRVRVEGDLGFLMQVVQITG